MFWLFVLFTRYGSGRLRPAWASTRVSAWASAWTIAGLVLALLLAQSLGQIHAVRHRSVVASQATQTATSVAAVDALGRLFSAHSNGSPDCRLYDQASADGAAALVTALVLPVHSACTAVAIFAGDALARWAAQFQARAPPLTS